MAKFVGIKHNHICVVSDNAFCDDDLEIVELPTELSAIPDSELISNWIMKDGKLIDRKSKKPINQMKIAFVGNWNMRCGIASYSEKLWPEITKHVGDFKLFIEGNEDRIGDPCQFGNRTIEASQVVACWKRGQSLQLLIKELKEYDPDIIWIQHEYGLWPNASHWLSLMNRLSEYRVIVTMHSVFHHKDKTIVEASIPEIVVHLQGAYDVLKNEKHIPGKVYVIPHGCSPCFNKVRLWNFYKSNHTFIQAGFGFRYKNFQDPIKAVGILKEKFDDVFLTILFSESPHNLNEHQVYYNELMTLIEKLGVQENVAIIRGFQSDETLDSYLRTNKVAVFAYSSNPEHEVFGASGAARLAMSTNMPVITSNVPHFSDLPTVKVDTPEEMAVALDELFSSEKAVQNQLSKQNTYLVENSWENMARKYLDLFANP